MYGVSCVRLHACNKNMYASALPGTLVPISWCLNIHVTLTLCFVCASLFHFLFRNIRVTLYCFEGQRQTHTEGRDGSGVPGFTAHMLTAARTGAVSPGAAVADGGPDSWPPCDPHLVLPSGLHSAY